MSTGYTSTRSGGTYSTSWVATIAFTSSTQYPTAMIARWSDVRTDNAKVPAPSALISAPVQRLADLGRKVTTWSRSGISNVEQRTVRLSLVVFYYEEKVNLEAYHQHRPQLHSADSGFTSITPPSQEEGHQERYCR